MSSDGQELATAAPNPWFSMWTRPRSTMRWILDTDPHRFVPLLAIVAGVSSSLNRASTRSLGDAYPLGAVLGISLLIGLVSGPVLLLIGGLLLTWTGRWLGGTGSRVHVRAAVAWPHVITAWGLILWIPNLLLVGNELFTTQTPRLDSNPFLVAILFATGGLDIVLAGWLFVVLVLCIAQAHRFSAWRALGSLLLAMLLVVIPIYGLIMYFALMGTAIRR